MKIEYRQAKNTAYMKDFLNHVGQLAASMDVKRICEVGGGANPVMSLDEIKKYDLEYTLLDISAEELAKAPNGYQKIQADITSPHLNLGGEFDLIFSIMLAEHVSDGFSFHKNALSLLREGGYALHLFPTLYALPFVVNQLLPEQLSKQVLGILAPHRIQDSKKLKFPAYYSWCRGPSKGQINKFTSIGFQVEEYIGFFGTPSYFRKNKLLNALDEWVSSVLVKNPQPLVTSYAYIILRKDSSLLNKER